MYIFPFYLPFELHKNILWMYFKVKIIFNPLVKRIFSALEGLSSSTHELRKVAKKRWV